MINVGVIAALHREIAPLLRGSKWRATARLGTAYRSYENENAILVCGGIGGRPAGEAAEAVVVAVRPAILISVGLAGALVAGWKSGAVILPATVIDASTGATVESNLMPERAGHERAGVLVSAGSIARAEPKAQLAARFRADAVDMEAASVARVAARHGIGFVAVKAISDEYDFAMPDLSPWIDSHGTFSTGRFVLHAVFRPVMWSTIAKLASNSNKASRELSRVLRSLLGAGALTTSAMPSTPSRSAADRRSEPILK